MAQHAIYIAFVFALGACVGSFLNVVVWRLPRVEHVEGESLLRSFWRSARALTWPPSQCPKCGNALAWYDNVPVIGWIKLGGRCRHCRQPISKRYPIVEAVTGAIFTFYYVMFFMCNIGPCPTVPMPESVARLEVPRDLWIYLLYMSLAAALLAASLIDAELFIIPMEIPYVMAVIGFTVHAIFDAPALPGALNLVDARGLPTVANALAAGGLFGLAVSLFLFWRKIIPLSFPQGEPILEVDRPELEEEIRLAKKEGRDVPPLPPAYAKREIRAEMRKEILFLMPPMVGAVIWMLLTENIPFIGQAWARVLDHSAVTGVLGAVLGALVGGWLVWVVRVLATLAFGRVAMGLGDVHLMFGVGAVIGAGASVVTFFVAPFFGIVLAVYRLIVRSRQELPYGPYLSLGTGVVIFVYCPIAAYYGPALRDIMAMLFS